MPKYAQMNYIFYTFFIPFSSSLFIQTTSEFCYFPLHNTYYVEHPKRMNSGRREMEVKLDPVLPRPFFVMFCRRKYNSIVNQFMLNLLPKIYVLESFHSHSFHIISGDINKNRPRYLIMPHI